MLVLFLDWYCFVCDVFFFLMIRRPPRSTRTDTLFPYTTLCRSREALLLVGIALERLGEPYSIQAFSGEGPNDVTISPIKAFHEPYGKDIALRIAVGQIGRAHV